MKVNELRINNFISSPRREIDIVKQVNENNVWGQFYEDILPIPIPLTEKWLLDFGFSRHHEDYSNNVIYIKNIVDNDEFEWGVYPNELGSGTQIKNRIPLKYVHQLQNLYFALTGHELIIF